MSASKVAIATEDDAHWDFAEDANTMAALESAARKAAAQYEQAAYDDLLQEAMLWLSVRPEFQDLHPAQIHLRAVRRLGDRARVYNSDPGNAGSDTEDWEQDMGLFNRGMQHDRMDFEGQDYPRELVQKLLEAMFHGWAMDSGEYRPEPGMPRAKPNPARMGNDIAHRIDVERAWKRALLNPTHRTWLWRWVQGESQAGIAEWAGVSQQSVAEGCDRSLRAICRFLNGESEK